MRKVKYLESDSLLKQRVLRFLVLMLEIEEIFGESSPVVKRALELSLICLNPSFMTGGQTGNALAGLSVSDEMVLSVKRIHAKILRSYNENEILNSIYYGFSVFN